MNHLTDSRIAAALAAATQPEGETPWRLLLTRPPMTHSDVRTRISPAENPDLLGDDDNARTVAAEASRARVIGELARRDAYMGALATSEHLMSTTAFLPDSVTIYLSEWADGPHALWYFHHLPEAVASLAAHLDAEVSEHPHGDSQINVSMEARIGDNLRFEAYTLVQANAAQVTE